MIFYSKAISNDDIKGILNLQRANLPRSLSMDEIQSQGFVTIEHTDELLKKLNNFEKHVIAKDDDKVIGYVLAMTKNSRFDIPILFPMFDAFNAIRYKDKKISDFNYIVVGQVCVAKEYRGQRVFDHCYGAYKEFYKDKYDFAITEIAKANSRSLKAHLRIGFKEVHSYSSADKTDWIVVIWDWKNGSYN